MRSNGTCTCVYIIDIVYTMYSYDSMRINKSTAIAYEMRVNKTNL